MKISVKKHFLLFSSICVLLLSGCQNLGKEVDFGDVQLFYKDGATKENAEKLGEYLVKSDFWQGHEGKFSVQLLKNGEIYQVNFPVKEGLAHDIKYVVKVSAFASTLSEQVFNDAKVEIHLCDNRMETKNTVGMDHENEMKTYTHNNYSIKYPVDWTLTQQEGFEFLLESPIVYNYVHYNSFTLNIVDLATLDVTTIEGLSQKLVDIATNAHDGSVREVIQKTTGKKNGLEFAKVVYNIEQDDDTTRVTGVLYKAGRKCYLLTARAGQETLNRNSYQKTESNMFNSFEIQ